MTQLSKMLPEEFRQLPNWPMQVGYLYNSYFFCILTKYLKRSNWRKQRFILSPGAEDIFHQGREDRAKESSFLTSTAEKTRKKRQWPSAFLHFIQSTNPGHEIVLLMFSAGLHSSLNLPLICPHKHTSHYILIQCNQQPKVSTIINFFIYKKPWSSIWLLVVTNNFILPLLIVSNNFILSQSWTSKLPDF